MGLIRKFKISSAFWKRYQELIVNEVIPFQEKALRDEVEGAEKSHAIENFRLAAEYLETGIKQEQFYGMAFQDSDLAKWLEAAAYSLQLQENAELEARMDALIDLIGRAQQADGYLDTYFTLGEEGRRFQNLQEGHELYCMGHMIEAAVAYYESTGKSRLLHIMERCADCIDRHFRTVEPQGYPGHPEIELALLKLYHVTGREKYRELSEHFIRVRGEDPDFFRKEKARRGWDIFGMDAEDKAYAQNHKPVILQTEAVGHAVRAVYLYTAMADLAAQTQDAELEKACKALWDSIEKKRMYLTGGIGSTCLGEAFTADYHLPNDTAYAETCAAVGLIFFASKMQKLYMEGRYADVMERALYNCVLAGMQLDGKSFFYVNPLEAEPGITGVIPTHRHVLAQRPKWFGCACCPPNVARLLASIADYAWSIRDKTVYVHLFIGGALDLKKELGMDIIAETQYPYEGDVTYRFKTGKDCANVTLALRLPAWCRSCEIKLNGSAIYEKKGTAGQYGNSNTSGKEDTVKVNKIKKFNKIEAIEKNGYLYLTKEFTDGDEILLHMEMEPVKIYANPLVAADSGMAAVMRGPLVYCAEEADNGYPAVALRFRQDADITVKEYDASVLGGIRVLETDGYYLEPDETLYSDRPYQKKPCRLRLIPYYAWSNRGLNQMRVWMPETM